MVGTNFGAGQRARARRVAWTGALIAAGATEAIGLAAAFFPNAHDLIPGQRLQLHLASPSSDPGQVALAASHLFAEEFAALAVSSPDVVVLTILPVELRAVASAFGLDLSQPDRPSRSRLVSWSTRLPRPSAAPLHSVCSRPCNEGGMRVSDAFQRGNSLTARILLVLRRRTERER